jgi:hypothetical protein
MTQNSFIKIITTELAALTSVFFKPFLNSVKENVLENIDILFDRIQKRILVLQQKLIQQCIIMTFLILGLVMLLIGGSIYLIEIAQLPKYLVFLFIGISFLLVSFIQANIRA